MSLLSLIHSFYLVLRSEHWDGTEIPSLISKIGKPESEDIPPLCNRRGRISVILGGNLEKQLVFIPLLTVPGNSQG